MGLREPTPSPIHLASGSPGPTWHLTWGHLLPQDPRQQHPGLLSALLGTNSMPQNFQELTGHLYLIFPTVEPWALQMKRGSERQPGWDSDSLTADNLSCHPSTAGGMG